MSRKDSKFLKKKIFKPCVIKTHIQIPQKNGKSEGSR